jgi:polar amino acid transport system permease protein
LLSQERRRFIAVLFDEPTSALDPELVRDVLNAIGELAKEGMTMIIVTYEMDFAMSISDRIVFTENGVIELDAAPDAIRHQDGAERVRRFIGVTREEASADEGVSVAPGS